MIATNSLSGTMLKSATLIAGVAALAACATVKVEPPDKPIEINHTINLNITQEVRVKLERDVENLINENPDLF